MTRLFIQPERLTAAGTDVLLDGPDHHYLVHVLRRRPGDRIVLLDGHGRRAEATVSDIAGTLHLHIEALGPAAEEAGPRLTLLMALLKGDRFELVLQKATELGVQRIVPVRCTRSVARPEGPRATERHRRWERILRGAAQQCRRPDLPVLDAIADLADVLVPPVSPVSAPSGDHPVSGGPGDGAVRLLPFEGALRQPLLAVLPRDPPAEIVVLIGPEGGFTGAEVSAARAAGFVPCGLGPRILRAETAALATLAALSLLWCS